MTKKETTVIRRITNTTIPIDTRFIFFTISSISRQILLHDKATTSNNLWLIPAYQVGSTGVPRAGNISQNTGQEITQRNLRIQFNTEIQTFKYH